MAVVFFERTRQNYYEVLSSAAAQLDLEEVNEFSNPAKFAAVLQAVRDLQRHAPDSENTALLKRVTRAYEVIGNPARKASYDKALDAIRDNLSFNVESFRHLKALLQDWMTNLSSGEPEKSYWSRFFEVTADNFYEHFNKNGFNKFVIPLRLPIEYCINFINCLGGAHEILSALPLARRGECFQMTAFSQAFAGELVATPGKIRLYHLPKKLLSEGDIDTINLVQAIITVANLRNLFTDYAQHLQGSSQFSRLAAILNSPTMKPAEDYPAIVDRFRRQLADKEVRKLFDKANGKAILVAMDYALEAASPAMNQSRLFVSARAQSVTPEKKDVPSPNKKK